MYSKFCRNLFFNNLFDIMRCTFLNALFIHFFIAPSLCEKGFVDPNNLFTVFEQRNHESIPVESKHSTNYGVSSDTPSDNKALDQCNMNLTRALAVQVKQSMSKYRPGDVIRTSLVFYLSWEDAESVSNFLENSSNGELIMQAFISKIESAANQKDSTECRNTKSSFFTVNLFWNVLMILIILTALWTMHNFITVSYFSFSSILRILVFGCLILTYIMTSKLLYQEEISIRETKMSDFGHKLPSHCSYHTRTLTDSFMGLFGMLSKEDCKDYYKYYYTDTALLVSPLKVINRMIHQCYEQYINDYVTWVKKISADTCPFVFGPFLCSSVIFISSGVLLIYVLLFLITGGRLHISVLGGLMKISGCCSTTVRPFTPSSTFPVTQVDSNTTLPNSDQMTFRYIHNQQIFCNQGPSPLTHSLSAPGLFSGLNGSVSRLNDSAMKRIQFKSKKAILDERRNKLKYLKNKSTK